MRKLLGIALVLIAIVFPSGTTFAAPFTNGSFELPGGTLPVRYDLLSDPDYVTGWFSNGGYQIYASFNDIDGKLAGDGTFYVSFGHSGATGGTLTQTFDTVAGRVYRVNYLLTLQQGADPQSMKAEAFDGTSLLNSALLTNFVNPAWTNGPELVFTAASASTTLVFTDTTDTTVGGWSANWGLDAVTVSTVPVPSALLLLGPAMSLLPIIRRRVNW